MHVLSLQLSNYRAYVETEPIFLGPINVFIGANNAGKSSLLRAIYLLQDGSPNKSHLEVRHGAALPKVTMQLEGMEANAVFGRKKGEINSGTLTATIHPGAILYEFRTGHEALPASPMSAVAPDHAVVPYLSKRKVVAYSEDVRLSLANSVTPDFANLSAKLSKLANPDYPASNKYREACKAILGFVVTAVPSPNGQQPGVYLADGRSMPLDQMGEGVPNIVGLLADLAVSEGKIFLMEEPENDLHPTALKTLLNLIVESAKSNQFVVSTHSNIVARHLGATPDSRLYEVSAEHGSMPPASKVRLLRGTSARLAALRDLGYSLSDFDLWDGWLILEESSAERIIRDYLIPWFAPRLSRIRTLACRGSSTVEPTFADFHRLFLFAHMEQVYRDAAWVRIDGDDNGRRIVKELRDKYTEWAPDRFACFSEPHFERYYPAWFSSKVDEIFANNKNDKQALRNAKKALLEDVIKWLDEDQKRASAALELSAAEVIRDLCAIEKQLLAACAMRSAANA